MDILLKTFQDALPMFVFLMSVAGFIALTYIVATADKPQPTRKRLSMDMVRDTRYLNLE